MKAFLLAMAALAVLSNAALAGPNAGGTLVVHDAGLLVSQTNGSESICAQGIVPAYCEAADAEIDGVIGPASDPAIFKVYAAFRVGSAPRLMGLTWGVDYPYDIVVTLWGGCGNFELNDPNWPASGSGSSVTYGTVQTGLLTEVYWFAAYNYYGNPVQFQLAPNPSQGGVFGDDSVPAVLDPIAGYGAMGFDGPGIFACPGLGPEGAACCDVCTGECTIALPMDCEGTWMGDGTVCDPNPCLPPAGACCIGDCQCTVVPQCLCTGIYVGDGVLCYPSPCCLAAGACCAADGTCTITTPDQCDGTYMGAETTCEPDPCLIPARSTSWGRIKNIYHR
jgi:hypothetical protein